MDVGVGSFVFSLGLVTSRSAGSRGTSTSLAWSIFKALKKASPVLLLGLVRVLMVKGSEYPVSCDDLRPNSCAEIRNT